VCAGRGETSNCPGEGDGRGICAFELFCEVGTGFKPAAGARGGSLWIGIAAEPTALLAPVAGCGEPGVCLSNPGGPCDPPRPWARSEFSLSQPKIPAAPIKTNERASRANNLARGRRTVVTDPWKSLGRSRRGSSIEEICLGETSPFGMDDERLS